MCGGKQIINSVITVRRNVRRNTQGVPLGYDVHHLIWMRTIPPPTSQQARRSTRHRAALHVKWSSGRSHSLPHTQTHCTAPHTPSTAPPPTRGWLSAVASLSSFHSQCANKTLCLTKEEIMHSGSAQVAALHTHHVSTSTSAVTGLMTDL